MNHSEIPNSWVDYVTSKGFGLYIGYQWVYLWPKGQESEELRFNTLEDAFKAVKGLEVWDVGENDSAQ